MDPPSLDGGTLTLPSPRRSALRSSENEATLSLSSRRSLCDLLSKTYRSIIGVSWRRVSGTQQITAGCRPGGSAALLRKKRDGVNTDKH